MTSSFVASSQSASNPFSAPLPKRAKHHRRRHVPVGPAGFWFQSQAAEQDKKSSNKRRRISSNLTEEETGLEFAIPKTTSNTASNNTVNVVVQYASAWMAMQCDLNITTPMLSAFLSSSERLAALRPQWPAEYALLPELLEPDRTAWKLLSQRLLVLVHAVDAVIDVWMADLTDETGVHISAWLEPDLVREKNVQDLIRPGRVWLLSNVTMVLKANTEGTLERMLLIGRRNIERVWSEPTTETTSTVVTDQEYIQWMERRCALTQQQQSQSDTCRTQSPPLGLRETSQPVQGEPERATPHHQLHTGGQQQQSDILRPLIEEPPQRHPEKLRNLYPEEHPVQQVPGEPQHASPKPVIQELPPSSSQQLQSPFEKFRALRSPRQPHTDNRTTSSKQKLEMEKLPANPLVSQQHHQNSPPPGSMQTPNSACSIQSPPFSSTRPTKAPSQLWTSLNDSFSIPDTEGTDEDNLTTKMKPPAAIISKTPKSMVFASDLVDVDVLEDDDI